MESISISATILMLAAASPSSTWLRARRSRCVILLLFSPILIPFLFVTFPLLCAAAPKNSPATGGGRSDEAMRGGEVHCGGGGGGEERREEMGLLQRYLEDQLLLVGSVYDCGDYYDEDLCREIQGYDDSDSNTPLLA